MNHYGISAIHWNANVGEIDEVRLHQVVRLGRPGEFALRHGEPAWCADVAGLIRGGDRIWVMVAAAPRRYTNTDRVGVNVKIGGREHLYSHKKDGTPTTALMDLPRYRTEDDPPDKDG